MSEMADWNIDNALMPGDGSEADDCGFGCMRAELEQRIRELEGLLDKAMCHAALVRSTTIGCSTCKVWRESQKRIRELEKERDIFARTLDKRDVEIAILKMDAIVPRMDDGGKRCPWNVKAGDRECRVADLNRHIAQLEKQVDQLAQLAQQSVFLLHEFMYAGQYDDVPEQEVWDQAFDFLEEYGEATSGLA